MDQSAMILLFIKVPLRGRVKSRLAAKLGDDIALDLYRSFVHDILSTLECTGIPSTICFSPPGAGNDVATWLGRQRTYLAQKGDDLGARMEQAFDETFSRGFSRAVLIGSDIPDLPHSVLKEAIEALDRSDTVLGPATDGGYYLIGFRSDSFHREVFKGVPWSTNRVFDMTMETLRRTGRTVHLLPRWRDVDTIEDLRDLRDRNLRGAFAAGSTMRHLELLYDLEDRHA